MTIRTAKGLHIPSSNYWTREIVDVVNDGWLPTELLSWNIKKGA